MMPSVSGRNVKSIDTCFDIVEFLMSQGGATLEEVASDVGVARSTAHNHLSTLCERGYVRKDNETYYVGFGFLTLGEHAKNRNWLYESIHESVTELANETGEEADFTVPENGRLVSLYHEVGNENATGHQVGSTFYMHNTSAGKAILAELSDVEVDSILDFWGLPEVTDHTITEREALFAELDEIRYRGFAINDQEYMEGYRSVSAVVRTPADEILGALCVGGPMYRNSLEILTDDLVDALLDRIDQFESEQREHTSPNRAWEKYFNVIG